MSRQRVCATCNNTGNVPVDPEDLRRGYRQVWMTFCKDCCNHDEGFWRLKEHYGDNNNKWACNRCGIVRDKRPKNTDYNGKPVENTTLLEL